MGIRPAQRRPRARRSGDLRWHGARRGAGRRARLGQGPWHGGGRRQNDGRRAGAGGRHASFAPGRRSLARRCDGRRGRRGGGGNAVDHPAPGSERPRFVSGRTVGRSSGSWRDVDRADHAGAAEGSHEGLVMRALPGVSAAPGITVGRAVVLDRTRGHASNLVREADRAGEADRARDALRRAASDLETLASQLRTDGRGDDADIVETGVLMAMDPELIARVDTLILDSGIEAADALREAAEQTALELSVLLDPMLALRADDVRSVGRRAAAHLKGDALHVSEGVLIADSLGPADVAELAPRVRGIALAGGGVTAHAAIVARSLGLPMVVGVGEGLLEIEDGEEVLVDGDRGVVVRQPDAERASLARTDTERRRSAREIAVTLNEPQALQAHLSAVVDAGRGADLRLLVPMVTSAADIRSVRDTLTLVLEGRGAPMVGAMIETPEAAEAAREIAGQCDFLSIGTNDLTQLVLGLDREQSRKAPVLDPRVLGLVAATVQAGHDARIPVDVCGEAASDENSLPIIIGLGTDELSVAAARVGQVRQWVREPDFAECRRPSEALLGRSGHTSRQRV